MQLYVEKELRTRMNCKTMAMLILIVFLSTLSSSASPQANEQINNQKLISMNFKEADLEYVLDFFARASGYTIIKDADIKARITIISQKDIPVDEALSVLNSILIMKGYATIINGKVIKIVPLETAKQETTEIKVGSEPSEIDQTDTIVTQIMPLTYTSASQIVKDLKDLVPKYGVMVAHSQSNSLIITATSSNINRFARIIKALDFPVSDLLKVEVFFLKYRDAETLAQVIQKIFEKSKTDTTQQALQNIRRFRGGPPGFDMGPETQAESAQASTETSERLQLLGDVRVTADKTTNSLVVSASQDNMKVIRDLVSKLDVQTSGQPMTRVFALEHADATTLANKLNQAFSSTTTARTTQTGFGRFGPGGTGFIPPVDREQISQAATAGSILGLPEV